MSPKSSNLRKVLLLDLKVVGAGLIVTQPEPVFRITT